MTTPPVFSHKSMLRHGTMPVSRVTPFTYRDGSTFLEILKSMIKYINHDLIDQLDGTLKDQAEWLANEIQLIVDGQNEFTEQINQMIDDFFDDVNATLMGLNDQSMSDLINDNESLTNSAIDSMVTGELLAPESNIHAAATEIVKHHRDVIQLSDFGVVGDGVADDTIALQNFLDHLSANGGTGYMGYGSYRITESLMIWAPDKPFTLRGSGTGGTKILKDGEFGNGFNGNNLDGCYIGGFTIEGVTTPPNVQSNMSHGIALSNTRNTVVEDVVVKGWSGTAVIIFKNENYVGDVYQNTMNRIHCYGDGRQNNGLMHQSSNSSIMTNCVVKDLDLTGTPVIALQLKNGCTDCVISDCVVDGSIVGVGMGGDDAEAFGYRNIVHGVVMKNVVYGYRSSRHHSCSISFDIDMSAEHALRAIEMRGNMHYNNFKVGVRSPKAGDYIVGVLGYGNKIDITNIDKIGTAFIANFGESSQRNVITVGAVGDLSTYNSATSRIGIDDGTSNKIVFDYQRSGYGTGLSGVVAIPTRGGLATLSYSSTTKDISVNNGDSTFLRLSGTRGVSPTSNNAVDLGENANRWRNVYVADGLFLRSPNGSSHKVTVSNSGEIVVVAE